MVVTLRSATEQDAPAIADIIFSNRNDLNSAIYRNGVTASVRADNERKQRDSVKTPGTLMVVALEADRPEEIVGFAKWRMVLHEDVPAPSTGAQKEEEAIDANIDINTSLRDEFANGLSQGRKRYTAGKRHILLANLFIRPSDHRRGVGSKLMEHGLSVADESRLMAYLESSPAGIQLYTRYGFKEVDSFSVDLAQGKGTPRMYRTSLMVREAKSETKA